MHSGDAVANFLIRHLPDVDLDSIPRRDDPYNTSLSAETMAVLYEFSANLRNWPAPDLFWLNNEKGITFPTIDYDAINPDEIDDVRLRVCRIEDICDVDPDRKAALLRLATGRARMPKTVRRWLAKYWVCADLSGHPRFGLAAENQLFR